MYDLFLSVFLVAAKPRFARPPESPAFSLKNCTKYVRQSVGSDYIYSQYINKDITEKSYAYQACLIVRNLRKQKIPLVSFEYYLLAAKNFSNLTK